MAVVVTNVHVGQNKHLLVHQSSQLHSIPTANHLAVHSVYWRQTSS